MLQEPTLLMLASWQGSFCITNSWHGFPITKLTLGARVVSYFIAVVQPQAGQLL